MLRKGIHSILLYYRIHTIITNLLKFGLPKKVKTLKAIFIHSQLVQTPANLNSLKKKEDKYFTPNPRITSPLKMNRVSVSIALAMGKVEVQPETLSCSSSSLGLDSWPPDNP
jgi:hypothetical protein